ncbi:MAG: hypothetical protein ACRDPC_02205 [Solirubrobacteraceae bacterium]
MPLLQEALRAAPPGDSALRARLLSRLAGAARERAYSDQALAIARRLRDPSLLAHTLDTAAVALWTPDNVAERIEMAAEQARLADEIGDSERAVPAHDYLLLAYLELGDVRGLEAELQAVGHNAERLLEPALLWKATACQALFALMRGRFDDAERLIERAFTFGEESQSWNALITHRLQTVALRSARGGLEELEPDLARLAREQTAYPVIRCVLASVYAELGRETEARRILAEFAEDGFAQLPFNEEWPFGMTLLAKVGAVVGDTTTADLLYSRLLPYADRNAVGIIEFVAGSVSGALGELASICGRFDQAAEHLDAGLVMHSELGADPLIAHTELGYARLLLRRGRPNDASQARKFLRSAEARYRALGMRPWIDQARPSAKIAVAGQARATPQ